ncbi:hypothetical protein J6590_013267 [Homalodisca vitripennis]|nr:hypothetical protein J6590_013267 [Homalodisca vitripennis]
MAGVISKALTVPSSQTYTTAVIVYETVEPQHSTFRQQTLMFDIKHPESVYTSNSSTRTSRTNVATVNCPLFFERWMDNVYDCSLRTAGSQDSVGGISSSHNSRARDRSCSRGCNSVFGYRSNYTQPDDQIAYFTAPEQCGTKTALVPKLQD